LISLFHVYACVSVAIGKEFPHIVDLAVQDHPAAFRGVMLGNSSVNQSQ
jgi:hypothetical protein